MIPVYDLVVVGAGVLGSFHAYHALRRGLSVLLLEKDAFPQGATVRNFGQVVPSGMPAGRWQQYGMESTRIYKQIQRTFDIGVRAHGSLYVASDAEERGLLEELREINQREGYASVLWTQAQCLKAYPQLKPDYCQAGLFFPEEITVEPDLMIHRLLAYLQAQFPKLSYRPSSPVVDATSGGEGVRVRTSSGHTFQGEQLIVCSGSQVRLLFPELLTRGELEVSKLQMMQTLPLPEVQVPGSLLTGLTIRRYESFQQCPSFPQLSPGRYHPALQAHGVHILFKQARDGSLIIGDSHAYADAGDQESLGFDLDFSVQQLILQEAQKILHLPDWTLKKAWSGVYAQCKAGDLFHQQLDERTQVITGIGGKGMTTSAGLAQAIIQQTFPS